MALDDSLQAVAVAAGLVQLFLDWAVLEAAAHLLVTAHLLVQPQGLQTQGAVEVQAQAT
jgi:hypothetical protein